MNLFGSAHQRHITAWIVYDIAAHGYALMIQAVGYSLYFTSFIAVAHPFANGLWSLAVAIPLILAGLLSPWLGALADCTGQQRRILGWATLVCVVASALMSQLGRGDIGAGILLFIVAQLAYLLAMMLYNSYLPRVSTPVTSSRISGLAWGLSYLGSIICFLLCLPFIRDGIVVGNERYFANSFLVTAGFLLVFGIAAVIGLPPDKAVNSQHKMINPYQRILSTLRSWRQNRAVPRFLLAYYLINDALVTVIFFVAIFMKTRFGLGVQDILTLSLIFQLIAIPSTIFFGWLGSCWSQRKTLYVTLVIWIIVLGLMGFAEGKYAPEAIAITLGLVLGAPQSLLRSMYTRLIPPDQSGEYFGFHALAGRASSALGPLLFGLISALGGSQRVAMLSLGLFLLAGAIVLSRIPAPAIEKSR